MGYWACDQYKQGQINWYNGEIIRLSNEVQALNARKDFYASWRQLAENNKARYASVKATLKGTVKAYIQNARTNINSAYSYYQRGYETTGSRGSNEKRNFENAKNNINANILNSAIAYCNQKIAQLEGEITAYKHQITEAYYRINANNATIQNYIANRNSLERTKWYWVN